jgi:peptidoglycan/LPS O-acetylase OafA/YrhL
MAMVFAAVMTSVLMGLCISSYSLKNAERVWAYLLLVPNFVPQSLKKSDISQLWSVGVEMQMYLITPFVVDLLVSRETGKRRSWAFLGLAT